jgi:hypothetical protein
LDSSFSPSSPVGCPSLLVIMNIKRFNYNLNCS